MDNDKNEILRIGETEYKTLYTEKFRNHKTWKKPVYNRVLSQIPGTIVEICFNEGDKVNRGDKLFVYEAMKMRNNIYSRVAGTVKRINVKPGEKVTKDFILAEIEI